MQFQYWFIALGVGFNTHCLHFRVCGLVLWVLLRYPCSVKLEKYSARLSDFFVQCHILLVRKRDSGLDNKRTLD